MGRGIYVCVYQRISAAMGVIQCYFDAFYMCAIPFLRPQVRSGDEDQICDINVVDSTTDNCCS